MEFKKIFCRSRLIVFLVILTCSFFTGKAVIAKTDLKINPPSLSLTTGQTVTVEITIDTTVKIFGSDLIIKYDPSAITVEKVEAGKFWQNPQVLVNRIDKSAGKVYLSVFNNPAQSGNGSLASLAVKQISNKASNISPDNLTVLAGENGAKVSYSIQGLTISTTTAPTIGTTQPPTPTQNTISPTPIIATQSPVQVSASVNASPIPTTEIGPTIILETTITPAPIKAKVSTSFTLQLVALFLLIFGTLAFFTFKKNF